MVDDTTLVLRAERAAVRMIRNALRLLPAADISQLHSVYIRPTLPAKEGEPPDFGTRLTYLSWRQLEGETEPDVYLIGAEYAGVAYTKPDGAVYDARTGERLEPATYWAIPWHKADVRNQLETGLAMYNLVIAAVKYIESKTETNPDPNDMFQNRLKIARHVLELVWCKLFEVATHAKPWLDGELSGTVGGPAPAIAGAPGSRPLPK